MRPVEVPLRQAPMLNVLEYFLVDASCTILWLKLHDTARHNLRHMHNLLSDNQLPQISMGYNPLFTLFMALFNQFLRLDILPKPWNRDKW